MEITERIKTFEDALEITGLPNVPEFSELPEDLRAHFKAHYKLVVIAEALNEGWKVNWRNHLQEKYTPIFTVDRSNFEFRDVHTVYKSSYMSEFYPLCVCFKTEELAKYAGKQFLEIWIDFIVTEKMEPVSDMNIEEDWTINRFSIKYMTLSEMQALAEILLEYERTVDPSHRSNSQNNLLDLIRRVDNHPGFYGRIITKN
jgi:hypothetical protein